MTENGTIEMLTALDVQGMLHRLPDGRRWSITGYQGGQAVALSRRPDSLMVSSAGHANGRSRQLAGQPRELNELLSWEWLRTVQETFASLLGGWLSIAKTGANKATLSVPSLS